MQHRIAQLEARITELQLHSDSSNQHDPPRKENRGIRNGGKQMNRVHLYQRKLAERRARGEPPPKPCHCGGLHWRQDCPKQTHQKCGSSSTRSHVVSICEIPEVSTVSLGILGEQQVMLDSGASDSFTPYKHLLHDFEPVHGIMCRYAGQHTRANVTGKGTLYLRSASSGKEVHIQNVYLVPDLRRTLLGVLRCARSGMFNLFDKRNGGTITIGSEPFASFVENERLPMLSGVAVLPAIQASVNISATQTYNSSTAMPASGIEEPELHTVQLSRIWHQRLMHPGQTALRALQQRSLIPQVVRALPCEPCIYGKQTRVSRQPQRELAQRPLERLHVDVVGPLPDTFPPMRARYALVLTDEHSSFRVMTLSSSKSDIPERLVERLDYLNCQLQPSSINAITFLRADNGGEFQNHRLSAALRARGIEMEFTPAYSPMSNGRAERSNRIIFERVRTALAQHRRLPTEVWGELAFAAVYILNRTPTRVLPNNLTPYEILTGKSLQSLQHLRAIGARAFVRDPHAKKLDARVVPGRLVGYASSGRHNTAAYRILLDCKPARVITAVDVTFNESEWLDSDDSSKRALAGDPYGSGIMAPVGTPDGKQRSDDHSTLLPGLRRSSRSTHLPDRYVPIDYLESVELDHDEQAFDVAAMELCLKYGEVNVCASQSAPKTLQEALGRPDADLWQTAMTEELAALQSKQVYTPGPLVPGMRPIGTRWGFALKLRPDGSIERHKARLVAQGFCLKYGIDYFEVWAPTGKLPAYRAMLTYAAQHNYPVSLLVTSVILSV
jgi:hypothetical protein